MDKRILAAAGVLMAVVAVNTVNAQNKPADHVTAAESVKYTPLDPKDPNGAAISVISGDPQKGPVTLFLRLAKGAAPIHTHTANYHATLIKGQHKHWYGNTTDKGPALNPGSHWSQAGKAPHGDECLTAQCVLLVQLDGPYDYAPVAK
jgi:hypothetical protein